jgi:hypothetical protein
LRAAPTLVSSHGLSAQRKRRETAYFRIDVEAA